MTAFTKQDRRIAARTRELMLPAALRTDWLSPAQFEAMLDEEEWPDGEAD